MRVFALMAAVLGMVFALGGAGEFLRRVEAAPADPPTAATSSKPSAGEAEASAATGSGLSSEPEEPPDALHFSLSHLRLPADSPETQCVMALGRGAPDECKKIALATIPSAREPSLGRMRYLLARSSSEASLVRPALEAIVASRHILAPWAHLRLAELLRETDPHAALAATDAVNDDPGFRARLAPLRAILLGRCGRVREAEVLLREMVASAPAQSAATPASMTLANLLANRPDVASRKQALELYRRVQTRAPLSAAGEQARGLGSQVLASLPPSERKALAALPPVDAIAEADALYNGRAYDRALKTFAAIESRWRKNPSVVCEARVGQGKTLMSMRRIDQGVSMLHRALADCKAPEPRASAHFNLARAFLRQGDPTRAIHHYEAVVSAAPQHRLADDALLAAASACLDLDDLVCSRKRLTRLLAHQNQGDMRADAHFNLAWLERREGNLDKALAELEALIASGPGETSEDLRGRAAYWHARTLLDQGKREAARAEFQALFRTLPLTYYAQQALARLREIDPPAAKAVLAELNDPEPARSMIFGVRPELKDPAFERAVELLRLGEPARATEDLSALGLFDRKADDELFFLGAALLQEFGAQNQATMLCRRRMGNVQRMLPIGRARLLWRIAYPRAYAPLIDDIARNATVPPTFVRAVAREESSFDPSAVSSANAYGLIQLISSTAKSYARPLGLPYDPASLKIPDVNLRIGTSFMRDLFSRYADNPAVVPAAYNAGNGAADRWLRERPTLQLDEWIETIPYTETRRYTRRVLQSYGVYSWLDEGRLPKLPAQLPGRVVATSAAVSLREE